MKRKTIKNIIEISGIGLHKGKEIKMKLKPVSQETGIVFKRMDVTDKNNIVKVAYKNLFDLYFLAAQEFVLINSTTPNFKSQNFAV